MTLDAFTYLLENPYKVTTTQNNELDNILHKFPFFQAARAIQLKHLKDTNSYLYNDSLKVTAAYTTDRNILFEYITSKQFIKNTLLEENNAKKPFSEPSEEISKKESVAIDSILKEEIKKAEAILEPDLFQPKKEIQDIEEQLQINTPLSFQKEDTHSFTEWLKLTKAKPVKREESSDNNQLKAIEKIDRIERFIQQKTKLTLPQKSTSQPPNIDLSKPYTSTPTSLMTETLARVYLQQKNYNKAIQAYKILILKNPEKSGYFADQIRAIEKLINN
jgi:hypothetical protein